MNPKILVAVLLNGLTLTAAGAADLVVTVKGVPDDRGYVVCGIFNSEKSFLTVPRPLLRFGSRRRRATSATRSGMSRPANTQSVRSTMRTTTACSMPITRVSQPKSMGSPPVVTHRVLPPSRTQLSRLGTRPKPFPSSSGIDRAG